MLQLGISKRIPQPFCAPQPEGCRDAGLEGGLQSSTSKSLLQCRLGPGGPQGVPPPLGLCSSQHRRTHFLRKAAKARTNSCWFTSFTVTPGICGDDGHRVRLSVKNLLHTSDSPHPPPHCQTPFAHVPPPARPTLISPSPRPRVHPCPPRIIKPSMSPSPHCQTPPTHVSTRVPTPPPTCLRLPAPRPGARARLLGPSPPARPLAFTLRPPLALPGGERKRTGPPARTTQGLPAPRQRLSQWGRARAPAAQSRAGRRRTLQSGSACEWGGSGAGGAEYGAGSSACSPRGGGSASARGTGPFPFPGCDVTVVSHDVTAAGLGEGQFLAVALHTVGIYMFINAP